MWTEIQELKMILIVYMLWISNANWLKHTFDWDLVVFVSNLSFEFWFSSSSNFQISLRFEVWKSKMAILRRSWLSVLTSELIWWRFPWFAMRKHDDECVESGNWPWECWLDQLHLVDVWDFGLFESLIFTKYNFANKSPILLTRIGPSDAWGLNMKKCDLSDACWGQKAYLTQLIRMSISKWGQRNESSEPMLAGLDVRSLDWNLENLGKS